MSDVRSTIRTAFSVLIFVVALSQPAFTGLPGDEHSPAFSLVTTDVGTALYQRQSPYGTVDFVQAIQLAQGAALQLLHGPIIEAGNGEGVYGGNNPLITTQSLNDFWTDFNSEDQPRAFCLTNGQFYSSHASAVRLSFPLKIDGGIVSDGFAIDQYPNHQLMLEIWPHRADIVPLSAAALQNSTAPNILGGLSEYAGGRRPNMITGRTFVGVGQPRPDGSYSTIFIFTSRLARKTEASAILRSFGAEKIMMLDGGASTQLICQGESYVGPGRLIPQTIATLAGPPPDWTYAWHQAGSFSSCEPVALLVKSSSHPLTPINLWC
jgi:hypothetical protein